MKVTANLPDYIWIGEAPEIKAIEKAMRRAWKRDVSSLWPSHLDAPRYRDGGMYGIAVEHGDRHDTYYIRNADSILRDIRDN